MQRSSKRTRARMLETIDHSRDALYRYAFSMLRNGPDAEDALQDTFMRLVSRADDDATGVSNPRAWAFRVLRNICIDRIRQRKHALQARNDPQFGSQVHALDGSIIDAETSFIAVDALCHVTTAINRLPPEEAEALSLVVTEGLSYAETAYIACVPVGTIRSRLHRARRLLREALSTPHGGRQVDPTPRQRATNHKATP